MIRDRSKDAPKSAADLMRELHNDPAFVAQMQQRECRQQEAIARDKRALEPLLRELAESGFDVASLDQLRKSGRSYVAAVPILIRWLPRMVDGDVKEDIVRTLSVPWARPAAASVLINEFKTVDQPSNERLRWAIANGLAVVADDGVFEELLSLVQDKQYGRSREMLALALANMTDPRAVSELMNLLEDEEMVGHATMALGKLKASEAQGRLKQLTRHAKPWIRAEARKALKGMG